MKVVLLLLTSILCLSPHRVSGAGRRSQDGANDLYCERDNCYHVLSLTNEATKSEIKRAFRAISKIHHPDKKSTNPESPAIFQAAANAYEILTNEKTRENYDFYLEHPEEHMANQFRYYQEVAKKISVMPVLLVFVACLTIFKYLGNAHSYTRAVKQWKNDGKAQMRAKKEALVILGPPKKGKHSKATVAAAMEKWMDEQIEGGKIAQFPKKPEWRMLFVVQLIMSPYMCYQYVSWYNSFRRRLNANTLTVPDKEYLTYSTLGKNEKWWKFKLVYAHEEARELVDRKLWEGDNLKKYQEQIERQGGVEMMGLSKSTKKRYKRYLKAKRAGKVE